MNFYIPYEINEDGYHWTLINICNSFSRRLSFVFAEYENQYGHLMKLNEEEILALQPK